MGGDLKLYSREFIKFSRWRLKPVNELFASTGGRGRMEGSKRALLTPFEMNDEFAEGTAKKVEIYKRSACY